MTDSTRTTLISFLGRVPIRDGHYRSTDYYFEDGTVDHSAFFGFSLQRRVLPDHLVILGTKGSMWDHLFERDMQLGDAAEDERLALVEAVADKLVTQAQLDQLAPLLGRSLGCDVALRLIPYARDESEQLAVIQTLVETVDDATDLHLDITHGYRHLPLLALTALQYLQAQRPNLCIRRVWYGAYDEDSGDAPVHDLSGLLRIANGAAALRRFDKDGDYAELAALADADVAPALQRAAFLERTQQVGQARGELRRIRQRLTDQSPADPLAALFRELLQARITWIDENTLYQRQTRLARLGLTRGDYLRAALFGYEAFITRCVAQAAAPDRRNPNNYDHRQKARDDFESRKSDNALWVDYKLLRDLRNQLAHGIPSGLKQSQSAMSDATSLHQTLENLLNRLLPEDPHP